MTPTEPGRALIQQFEDALYEALRIDMRGDLPNGEGATDADRETAERKAEAAKAALLAHAEALAARVAALEAQHARDADTIVGLTKDRKRAYEIMAEVGTLAEWRKVPGNRTLEIEYKVAEPVIRQGGMEIVEYVLAEMARKIRAALRPGAPREEGDRA